MSFNSNAIRIILRNKKRLERKLKVILTIKGNEIEIEGKEVNIFLTNQVLEAIDKNFSVKTALLLTNEDYVFEEINIKSINKKKSLSSIKSRLIGTKGKTLKTISNIANCHLALNDNIISIIGPAESIKETTQAINSLIHGSKQSNVYSYLERTRRKE